jgi:hypothetical protein
MSHPLVTQLRFARSELLRGIAGVSDADARRHYGPMNSISWTIGHFSSWALSTPRRRTRQDKR